MIFNIEELRILTYHGLVVVATEEPHHMLCLSNRLCRMVHIASPQWNNCGVIYTSSRESEKNKTSLLGAIYVEIYQIRSDWR